MSSAAVARVSASQAVLATNRDLLLPDAPGNFYSTPVRVRLDPANNRTPSIMPSAPTVGVVVANHNNSDFVGKAIESVARQTITASLWCNPIP